MTAHSDQPFWDMLRNAADAVSEVRIRRAIECGDSWDQIKALADEVGWTAINDEATGRMTFITVADDD